MACCSDAVSNYRNGAELWGQASGLPACLSSSPHRWSWAVGSDLKNGVAGLSLRDRMLLHIDGTSWGGASCSDAAWEPLFGGLVGTASWEDRPRTIWRDDMSRLAWERVPGEGDVWTFLTELAATATWPQMNESFIKPNFIISSSLSCSDKLRHLFAPNLTPLPPVLLDSGSVRPSSFLLLSSDYRTEATLLIELLFQRLLLHILHHNVCHLMHYVPCESIYIHVFVYFMQLLFWCLEALTNLSLCCKSECPICGS